MKRLLFATLFVGLLSSCSIKIIQNGSDESSIGITNYENFKLNNAADTASNEIVFKAFTTNQSLTQTFDYAKNVKGEIPHLSGQTAFFIHLPNNQMFIIDRATIVDNTIRIRINTTTIHPNVTSAVITTPKVSGAQRADLYVNGKLSNFFNLQ